MERYEFHDVGGYVFKVYTDKDYARTVPSLDGVRTLYQCYESPSSAKQYHYEKWCEWFTRMHGMQYGVYSFNCHNFTMTGRIFWKEKWFLVYISKSRQELIPME